ncbi:efflux RND transporter permease subunit [Skermanella sp. TT6]|uniref:Efflux RND transporter permease subunit n=1 Tax=Skermanella cutis TaxID=2775420 RepID=A0ABX7B3N3_9PROT|nr:efflux RND transporter permease subunit [Skermanella sp. TT6]QQP88244.1 efflux RND transporter permease subunit [Skermanella sp. TT6]
MISDLSIKRPVLAIVLSALIVVIGIAALLRLPVRELPDVDTAVVTITTTYPGAAPEIIDTEIIEVIEGGISGVDGIRSIRSSSRLGRGRIVVEFVTTRDIDQAANDVRDAVGRVSIDLPEEADAPEIVKTDSDAQPIMRIAITSDRMTPADINDYASRFIVDRLSVLNGVAQVEIFGERRYAIRIWLNREALAARNLTVADVESALRRNNVELPAGELESVSRQFTIRTDTRLRSEEEFREIVVAQVGGFPIRLGDLAQVELGVEDDNSIVRSNGQAAVGLGVLRQSQANTIEVSNQVRAELEALRPTLPEGMSVMVSSDDAIFISQSIEEVVIALGLSVMLVIAVIFLFLHSARATIVPAVTIPVAVIGTLAFIYAFGFSINVLTLLALLLAIGLVVDDAIVVLENIQRRVEEGEHPLAAAFLGTRQVTFAVIATSLTLVSVFLPISTLEGQVGRLFAEFGIVMAAAVAISSFVALSLCAMLCSKLLRAEDKPGRIGRGLERAFDAMADGYRRLLCRALRMPLLVLAAAGAVSAGTVLLYDTLPRELTPTEDRGVFFIPVTAPEGSTAGYTDANIRRIEEVISPLRESGEADRVFAIVGFRNQPGRGFVVVGLTDWADRDRSQREIVNSIIPEIGGIPGVRAFPVNPAGLGQRGSSAPLQVVIGGQDYGVIQEWSDRIIARALENPGLQNVETDFEATRPQFNVLIDRRKADDLEIGIEQIGSTLQTMLASREVTDYVNRGRVYPVIIQARDSDRRTPADLKNIFVRSGTGGSLVPLNALVTLEELAAAPELLRYDRLPSITISASLADGYDLGSAIDYMDAIAAEELPPEGRLSYTGQSQQFLETSGGIAVTFGIALLIVFLVLAAQFESFVHPLIIMLTVPLGLAGALAALALGGLSLNIYSQVGMVLLIGLMAKNGILIVEFANQLRAEGKDVRQAITEGSALRFRPILMTVLSTVLGAVPLLLATGAGAESRVAIGTVIIGGLSVASVLTLFVTPVLYDLLARFTRPANSVAEELNRHLQGLRNRQPAE